MVITFWELFLVLLLFALTILVIFLIPTILELRKTLANVAKLANNLNKDLPEILENVKIVSGHTTKATERINEVVADVADFERRISKEIKEPAFEAVASIAGLLSGIQTFLTYFVKRKK